MTQRLKGLYHLIIACFALLYYRFPSRKLTVIGITGTDGKTTTTTLVYEILKAAGFGVSMITSVHAVIAGREYDTGFHVTTPNAWWIQKYLREAVNHGDTHFVLEVTSHALSQRRVTGVRFAVGAITNVTHEHLDWHKTFDRYIRTKLTLLKKAKMAVINRDESEVYTMAAPFLRKKKLITFGIRREAMITPKTNPFRTTLPGIFNRYNCLAALSIASALEIPHKVARETVENFSGVPGRMEVIQQKPYTIIVDFAHTPNAIHQVLKTVRSMTKAKILHVFGSAGHRDKTKRPLMGKASSDFADMIILTEEDYRTENVESIMNEIASGIPKEKTYFRFPNRMDAITFAIHHAAKNDIVIITGKGHEKSLCRGTTEYPWSDQEAIRTVLKQK